MFGWASIDRTLLVAGLSKGGTGLTPMETTTIFAWASSIAMVSSLIMGLVLDKYGPRTASVASNLLVGLGCWIFSSSNSFGGFALGTCTMAFGGPGISSAIVHIANLFPRNKFLVQSCLCGSITFSFSILAVFGNLWEHYGTGFRTLFGSYVVVIALSTVGAFCFLPDTPFVQEDSDAFVHYSDKISVIDRSDKSLLDEERAPLTKQGYVEATELHRTVAYGSTTIPIPSSHAEGVESAAGETIDYTPDNITTSLKDQAFWNQALSQVYLRNLLIFVVISFFVNFTIASISTEMGDQQVFSGQTQHDLSKDFTFIMSGGLIGSILVGSLLDRMGLETCTIVTLLLGQTSLVLRIVSRTYSVTLIGFVLYTLFRQFLFPVFIACLTARLGFKYFGILSGIGFALSGIVQVFMASLVHLLAGDCHMQQQSPEESMVACHDGRWTEFHSFQIVLLGVLIIIPVMDRQQVATK